MGSSPISQIVGLFNICCHYSIIVIQQLLHAIVNGWQQKLRNISVDVEIVLLISSIKGALQLLI